MQGHFFVVEKKALPYWLPIMGMTVNFILGDDKISHIICFNKVWFRITIIMNHILPGLKVDFHFLIVFFKKKSFNLWRSLLMIVFYQQTKTPISLYSRQGLNPRSFIQLSEILSVELIKTHHYLMVDCIVLQFFFLIFRKLTKYICNDLRKVIVAFAFIP